MATRSQKTAIRKAMRAGDQHWWLIQEPEECVSEIYFWKNHQITKMRISYKYCGRIDDNRIVHHYRRFYTEIPTRTKDKNLLYKPAECAINRPDAKTLAVYKELERQWNEIKAAKGITAPVFQPIKIGPTEN